MCLLRLCSASVWPIAMADLLSHSTSGTGGDLSPLFVHSVNDISSSSCYIQMAPCVAALTAMYSASHDDSPTVACFWQHQSTQLLPSRISQPVTERRVSLQLPQLASANTVSGETDDGDAAPSAADAAAAAALPCALPSNSSGPCRTDSAESA